MRLATTTCALMAACITPSSAQERPDAPRYTASGAVSRSGLFGVNLSGCEFRVEMCPSTDDVAFYAKAGVRAIRLPVRADRIAGAEKVRALKRLVDAGTSRGVYVIIDDHRYRAIADRSVRAFWLKIGPHFRGNRLVAFDLQNEPRGGSWESYGRDANALIADLRAAGIDNDLLLEWRQSSGANRADKKERMAKPCESAFCSLDRAGGLKDPLGRTILSPHSYWDADGSGRTAKCRDDTTARQQLGNATVAARRRGVKLFLGEYAFGRAGGLTPACQRLGAEAIRYMKANSDVWVGATLWGAGKAWSARYAFRLEAADDRKASFETPYGRLVAGSWED